MIEALLYLLVFGAGIGTGYALGWRARHATLGPMPNVAAKRDLRRQIAILFVIVMLILSGVFAAVMVTQAAADSQAKDRTRAFQEQAACISRWGEEVVETIETRNEATLKLERAEAAKDRAYDEIIRVSTLRNRTPPEATDLEGKVALENANAARLRVTQVRLEVADIRASTEYPAPPTLTCAVEIDKD